jgi:uncharacterized protein YndB with AHSA1/START domain
MLGAQMKRDERDMIYVCMGEMEIPVAVFELIEPQQVAIRSAPDQLHAATCILEEENGGTRVTVMLGVPGSLPEEARQEHLGPNRAGWERALANLKAYIDGAELPFPQGYVAALLGYRREAKETVAVERSIWIDAPRQRVWRALTDPEQVQQWFSPGTPWRLSALEVGGKLSVYNSETGADMYVQIIEALEPLQQLVLRSAPEPPETPYVTIYTLADENGGTRLTLTHTGYELETDETRHNNMEQNAFGFGMMLENLRAYVAGASLPYPQGF